jgi:hypothetical protein
LKADTLDIRPVTFKSKSPPKGLTRSKPLQTKAPMKSGSGLRTAPPSPADQRKAQQKVLQKATLRALAKARKAAESQNIPLSEWENDFIEGVTERIKTYGRAFADPDKGALNGTLSMRQGVKLREIRRKAEGKNGSGKRKSED